MAFADVIEREADALGPVGGEDPRQDVVVANALVLGDLEHDAGGCPAGVAQQQQELVDAMDRIEQCCGADVEEQRLARRKAHGFFDGSAPAEPVEVANLPSDASGLEDRLDRVHGRRIPPAGRAPRSP